MNSPGISKLFFVDKVVRLDNKSTEELANLESKIPKIPKVYTTLEEVYKDCKEKCLPEDFILDFEQDKKEIVLSKIKKFKNGNIRKKEVISLCYQEYVSYSEFEGDKFVFKQKLAQRPWCVGIKTFSKFQSAANEFLKRLAEQTQQHD